MIFQRSIKLLASKNNWKYWVSFTKLSTNVQFEHRSSQRATVLLRKKSLLAPLYNYSTYFAQYKVGENLVLGNYIEDFRRREAR